MKTIFVDTNSLNENGTLCINEIIINNMELHHGEKVIAYQDADSWEAEIVYADHKWGVVLLSDAKEISKERQEGHQEGFWGGYHLRSIQLIRVLEDLNFSADVIQDVRNKLGIK